MSSRRLPGIPGVLLLMLPLLATPVTAAAQAPSHPLDALTAEEYWIIYDAMKASGQTDSLTRYTSIVLHEPPKAEVLSWKSGDPFRREALVVVKQGPKVREAIVDVAGRKLGSWREIEGVQPNQTEEEFDLIEELVKAHPEWREAMRRRGISDLATIHCDGGVFGNFGTTEEVGGRVARAHCHQAYGALEGAETPVVEGVIVLIDLDARKVVRVIDSGAVPTSRASADHGPEMVGPTREIPSPILVQQPAGPGFTLEGHEVSWQNWKFHFRIDPRSGLVVSRVRYADNDEERSVLYQGSLSEIFVPYMDPSEGWYFITYFDVGEINWGLASSLERGSDCPELASFFDAVYVNDFGIPRRQARAACLFERETGDIAWRHDSARELIESRARRDLVLRMIATLGNYDYLVDWVFQQDGSIRIVGGATGVVAVKSVASPTAVAVGTPARFAGSGSEAFDTVAADAYGRFVAENTVAINHDHFLSFRLDLDIDGTENSLVVDRIIPRSLTAGSPRKSIWAVESSVARIESEGKLGISMESPALWRVTNPVRLGPTGYPTSYHIRPGHTAMSLLADDDNPQLRGAFSKSVLWVTPHDESQRFATGLHVTGGSGEDGLPEWTKANRSIEQADIVVWYTMGIHHVARSEDWPVMPIAIHELELRPFDFFARNPALDLPRR
jgi:primary-amine oxidase